MRIRFIVSRQAREHHADHRQRHRPRMASGSMNEPNCTTRMRYISITAVARDDDPPKTRLPLDVAARVTSTLGGRLSASILFVSSAVTALSGPGGSRRR